MHGNKHTYVLHEYSSTMGGTHDASRVVKASEVRMLVVVSWCVLSVANECFMGIRPPNAG